MHLVWHRDDLRVHDHPPLVAAAAAAPVAGVVVLEPDMLDGELRPRDTFYLRCVAALRDEYTARGGILLVRPGLPQEVLPELVRQLGSVDVVHAISAVPRAARDTERECARTLGATALRLHEGAYVHEPDEVRTSAGTFYTVFAPFFRHWRSLGTPAPLPPPRHITTDPRAAALDPGAIPGPPSEMQLPPAGEAAALDALEAFVAERLPAYDRDRDRLDGRGSSHLSPWLAVGALSARAASARVEAVSGPRARQAAEKWLSELAWRDFLADLLYHRPDLRTAPFDPRWTRLSWPGDDDRFTAWRDGRTGVAAVNAAMHQLARTGWISNRARMIAAQFLAKNLRVDWRRGARVFEDWLVDADVASNTGNWQWAAGLGIDNVPYFRVMNPESQARRHDPDGEWRRRWAPPQPGDPHPDHPIVDLAESRRAYVEAARRAHSGDAPG